MTRLFLSMFLVMALSGCHRHVATSEDCRFILDRIVELELHELGFRDPALAVRKVAMAERLFAADLLTCTGVRIKETAIDCVRQATSVEEISHRCLR
jgi:hypothetical protein